MQINLYIASLIATGLLSASLGAYILRRRRAWGSIELALLLLAAAEWALAISVEAAVTTRPQKVLWSAIAYPGTVAAPVLLLYALRHANLDRWITRRRVVCLFILPIITAGMAATNEWHRLLWTDVILFNGWGGVTAQYLRGPWWWLLVGYSYLAAGLGFVILLWAVLFLPHLYSRQSRLLVVASAAPLAASGLYVLIPRAVAGFDPTPAAFALTGTLLALAIFRYRLLDLVPLARESLFENTQDGVLFLDAQRRVVDLNRLPRRCSASPRRMWAAL